MATPVNVHAETAPQLVRVRERKRRAWPAWFRRQGASAAMNALIALVVGVTWWFAWPPSAVHWSVEGSLLAVFSLWCLSFLPGWMYVRFLGLRAGALWDEYVLSLHRLGCDRPENLPEPPATSEYHAEWQNAGGPLHKGHDTIYQQKFDSYYGKSVSSRKVDAESGVRVESMFPVLLLTVVLAVAWAAVLWQPRFLTAPFDGWDVLKFGFFGAYFFVVQTLIRRFFQSDLRPSAYAAAVLRIIIVLILLAALHQLLNPIDVRTEAAVAFVVGFFPLVGLQALQRLAAATLKVAVPAVSPAYPLNQLDGLNVWYQARLLEEGIEDLQNLTTANLVDVVLHTRVPVNRLVDWVDQAHLYLRLESSSAAKQRKKDDKTVTTDQEFLRGRGIRTATDLVRAFPPESSTVDENARWYALSRALKADTSLHLVWNWQNRGASLREESVGK